MHLQKWLLLQTMKFIESDCIRALRTGWRSTQGLASILMRNNDSKKAQLNLCKNNSQKLAIHVDKHVTIIVLRRTDLK